MHVRVGTAVTAEELRCWAVKDGWALDVDVSIGESVEPRDTRLPNMLTVISE